MKGAYQVALLCGAVPLLVGISVFLLWVATRQDWLMGAGAFVLFAGFAFFMVGVVALVRYCVLAFLAPDLPPRFWASTIACAVLLLSNFPAAGAIIWKVLELESRYTVVLENESDEALEDVRIVGRGRVYAALATIPPGEAATRSFQIAHEGPLEVEVGGVTTTIEGYVTGSQGGHAIVTFKGRGRVSVLRVSDA